MGSLSVSAAETYNANVSVTPSPVTLGDTNEATAIIHVTLAESGINEAVIKVSSPIGSVAKTVELVDENGVVYTAEQLSTLDYAIQYITTDGEDIAEDFSNIDNLGKFYLSAKDDIYAITEAFIKVTFTIGSDIGAGTYAINIDIPEAKVIATSPSQDIINLIYAGAAFDVTCEHSYGETVEVTAPTCSAVGAGTQTCSICGDVKDVEIPATNQHTYTYTSNNDGTHTPDCSECDTVFDPENCSDGDTDDDCDKCGYVMVVEPVCEHAWEVTSAAPGTATDAPGYINLTCAECGEESNDNVVTYHGKFRCNSYSVELKSEIILGYENAQDRYSSVPDGADSGVEFGFMVFTDSTDAIVSVLDLVNDKKLSSSGKYAYELKVASTDMLDTYGSTFYAYCDGQWYSGKTATASIAGLVTSNFATFDDAKKTLFVDLLNYGAAVQTRFEIKTEALANSTLTAEQLAYGTSETVPPSEYTAPDVDNSKDVYTTSYGLESKSKLILRYKFNAKNFKNSRGYTDATNLKAVVTYEDAWGIEHSTEYSYDPTTTELHDVEPLFTLVAGKTNQYEMAYLDFTACDFRIPITISFYDHEGVQVDQAVTFSVENLIATAIGSASENEVALFNAILNYCDSARAVFVG